MNNTDLELLLVMHEYSHGKKVLIDQEKNNKENCTKLILVGEMGVGKMALTLSTNHHWARWVQR